MFLCCLVILVSWLDWSRDEDGGAPSVKQDALVQQKDPVKWDFLCGRVAVSPSPYHMVTSSCCALVGLHGHSDFGLLWFL